MFEIPIRLMGKIKRSYRSALYGLHGRLHDTVTVKTKQGRLTISTRDEGIGAPLFRERQYEFDSSVRCVQFLKDSGYLPASDIRILDIGANIGLISTGLLLADQVQKAVAIEPEPNNYGLLRRNVDQNDLSDRICCLNMAVNDKPSTLTMEISPGNPGDHRIRATPAAGATERLNESARQAIEVPSLPMTQILELPQVQQAGLSMPSLIWIDVQGYEGFVFKGLTTSHATGLPTVSEVWPYGILRAGMTLEEFHGIVSSLWSDYWVFRRQRFTRYPISVFDRYMEEIGPSGAHENVIFTQADHNLTNVLEAA